MLDLKFNVNQSKFQNIISSKQCKFLSEKKFSKIWVCLKGPLRKNVLFTIYIYTFLNLKLYSSQSKKNIINLSILFK